MAATAVHQPRNANTVGTGLGGNQRGLFRNQVSANEGNGIFTFGGSAGGVSAGNGGGGVRVRTDSAGIVGDLRRRELSGDEVEEIEDGMPTKRLKVVEETVEVPAAFFGQIVGMLEGFGTKGTIWYDSPEAEKKRDKSAFVLWKGRTKNDGTMTLSIMSQDRTVREVIATEVSIAQQFKDIFDPNSASRIFELVSGGTTIQKAVFQTLNEQNEGSSSD